MQRPFDICLVLNKKLYIFPLPKRSLPQHCRCQAAMCAGHWVPEEMWQQRDLVQGKEIKYFGMFFVILVKCLSVKLIMSILYESRLCPTCI